MKINLKVSNREKILIIILLIIMIIGAYYNFIYVKQAAKIQELTKIHDDNKSKIVAFENDKLLNQKIEKNIKIENAKILEVAKDFLPSIIEEKILVILDNMINESNVQCNSIAISDTSDETLQKKESTSDKINSIEKLVEKYKYIEAGKYTEAKNIDTDNTTGTNNTDTNKAASTNNPEAKEKTNPEVKKLTITLSVKGSYDEVIKFVDEVKGFYKRIVINNINFTAEEESISANMLLSFYAVPKLIEEDIDYNKWRFEGDYGKTNIFKDNAPGKITTVTEEKKSDFAISVRPITSDLPTVILGRTVDKSSYIYADNEGIENVEFYVTEKAGKYYYKYKTSKEFYPKGFEGDGTPFTFTGDNMLFKVFSRARVSDKDVNGVSIKIYNNTNKSLQVIVEDDDKTRARVNITKAKGDITVKSN